jgi:hypothetical protein
LLHNLLHACVCALPLLLPLRHAALKPSEATTKPIKWLGTTFDTALVHSFHFCEIMFGLQCNSPGLIQQSMLYANALIL